MLLVKTVKYKTTVEWFFDMRHSIVLDEFNATKFYKNDISLTDLSSKYIILG